jgi:hypothetical protein
MDFDFAKAAAYTENVVKSAKSVSAGMTELIDFCETNMPNPVWASIRKLDFESEVTRLHIWLEQVLTQEPPDKEINGFWFGVFNPELEDEQIGCDFYVSGSTRFDPNDETGDWSTWEDDSYLPEDRYANSQILNEIYRLVNESGTTEIGEYILCLGYTGLAVKQLCAALNPALLRGERETRAVAVGFDEGDFIVINE